MWPMVAALCLWIFNMTMNDYNMNYDSYNSCCNCKLSFCLKACSIAGYCYLAAGEVLSLKPITYNLKQLLCAAAYNNEINCVYQKVL